LIDCNWVRDLTVPMHLGLVDGPFVPHIDLWEPCCFTKVPDGPQTYTLNVLWVQEGAQICMSKWSLRFTLTENVDRGFISAPHLLHNGLSDSPIRWRCLLRVLCPVRRPVTALDCVLLKDRNLALIPRQGPEISSRACLWVLPRPQDSELKVDVQMKYKKEELHVKFEIIVHLVALGVWSD
jgi:hypothetical protein